ncbi:AREL1 [Branchiostoma lanceolatum]|uniref:HECT-type E3 ubiquitin transferase n=1 Tax=Branchiostoma lanceolatum TaxID=7740 RepID=A0A8K0EUY0_BRALA|nr:AREL1 [Branchiostoma lanceolatum]
MRAGADFVRHPVIHPPMDCLPAPQRHRCQHQECLFNIARLRAKRKTITVLLRELMFANDTALCSHSEAELQGTCDAFNNTCYEFGQTISVKKTVAFSTNAPPPHITIHVNETTLINTVEDFRYLGSTASSSGNLNREVGTRIGQAANLFGKLKSRAWDNKYLTIHTKTVELVPGGVHVQVTNDNKLQYLDSLAQYRLAATVKEELEHFLKGLVHGLGALTAILECSLRPFDPTLGALMSLAAHSHSARCSLSQASFFFAILGALTATVLNMYNTIAEVTACMADMALSTRSLHDPTALSALAPRSGQIEVTDRARRERRLNELIPDNLLSIFDENELELLICGTGEYSIADFKQHCKIQGGAWGFEKVLDWFWTIVASFTQEEMARLLQFTTGSSQLPPGGFAELHPRFQICSVPLRGMLPTAHTCFNQLCLPDYDSCEQLHKMLILAITEGSQGFGMA